MLAERIGRSQPHTCRLLKMIACPINTKAPWSVAEAATLKEFADEMKRTKYIRSSNGDSSSGNKSKDGASDGNLTKNIARARLRLLKQQVVKERQKNQILKGNFLPREQVEQGWVDRARYFKSTLMTFAQSTAPLLTGIEDVDEIERILNDGLMDVLTEYARPPRPGLDDVTAA